MRPRDLDEVTLPMFGKPAMDCTREELTALAERLEASVTRRTADVDRAEMVAREASACGCRIEAPLHDDGSPDIGRGRVRHTCGRRPA